MLTSIGVNTAEPAYKHQSEDYRTCLQALELILQNMLTSIGVNIAEPAYKHRS